MKRLIVLLSLLMMTVAFVGCTADYDTFGESPYKKFNDISFEEQNGDASVYEDEHLVKVKLQAPPDSLETWDSVTVEKLDISSMASLHLVESKFKAFPSDSVGLDSLATEVSYSKAALRVGNKIRIPKSHLVYVVVVAENGDPSIWKVEFTIPGVAAVVSDPESGDSEESADSKNSSDSKGSGSSATSGSSASKEDSASSSGSEEEVVKNSSTYFKVRFENQLKSYVSGDTIVIRLNNGSEIGSATLDSVELAQGASVSPKPSEVKEWKKSQSFEVTAEDGTKRAWVVAISIAEADEKASSDKELKSISAEGETADATISEKDGTVVLHLPSKKAASSVKISLDVSETASSNLSGSVNLLEDFELVLTAEDGSKAVWKVSADYPIIPSPRIKALKINGKDAVVDSALENDKWVHWIHYDEMEYLSDLTNLKVSDIVLSDGAKIDGVKDGDSYDLGKGVSVTVSNGDENVAYEIRAGYQLPNSDFSAISYEDVWNNANQTIKVVVTITVTTAELVDIGSGKGVRLKTDEKAGKTASGSIYTADFNPNSVGALSLASTSDWPDGNELIDFGKHFEARPRYFEFLASYEGIGDSCDAYIMLENRTGDKNVNRDPSSDVNTLVASAWFRSKSLEEPSRSVPDLVSISEPDDNGMRWVRMKLTYGSPLEGSPIENSSTFATKKASSLKTAIDNSLIEGNGSDNVTHIRVVFASSANGNHYEGKVGATLIVDEMRLIY